MSNDGTVKLKGKTYFTVARRVADFRATHPIADGWGLITKIVHMDDTAILFRAAVVNPAGAEVAVGFAEEQRSNRGVNSTSALENAETSAIGRALAAAGLGGDGAYASADELINALSQQRQPRQAPRPARDTVGSVTWAYSALETLGLKRAPIDKYLGEQGWSRLKDWNPEPRKQFVKDVSQGQHPDLYTPEQS